jgi:hypothetical protein
MVHRTGTAVKAVNFLASLLFMDRQRFTLSNRDRTKPYETSIITILLVLELNLRQQWFSRNTKYHPKYGKRPK